MPLPIVKPPLPPNLLGQRNENIDTIIFQTAAPVNLILPLGGKFAVFLQDEPSGHADFGGSSQWICRPAGGVLWLCRLRRRGLPGPAPGPCFGFAAHRTAVFNFPPCGQSAFLRAPPGRSRCAAFGSGECRDPPRRAGRLLARPRSRRKKGAQGDFRQSP